MQKSINSYSMKCIQKVIVQTKLSHKINLKYGYADIFFFVHDAFTLPRFNTTYFVLLADDNVNILGDSYYYRPTVCIY